MSYAPILIFLIVTIVIGVVFSIAGKILSVMLGANKPTKAKKETFECGFPTFGDSRKKIDVKFYLVAVLFLIFDLEIAFMVPWGVNLKNTGSSAISIFAFFAMIIFLTILFIGFIYEWKKGALEWE